MATAFAHPPIKTPAPTLTAIQEALQSCPIDADRTFEAAEDDHDIMDAWVRRQRALRLIEQRGTFFDVENRSPRFAADFDKAEHQICTLPAATPRAALAKLWVALAHTGGGRTEDSRSMFDEVRRAAGTNRQSWKKAFMFDQDAILSAIETLEKVTALPLDDQARWSSAWAAWEAAHEKARLQGLPEEVMRASNDQETVAAETLMATPAPTMSAILGKLKVASIEEGDVCEDSVDRIIAEGNALIQLLSSGDDEPEVAR